jgi:triosephosphate isomerase
MKKKMLLGANWKMNAIPCGALDPSSPFRSTDNVDVIVFPSFLDIDECLSSGLQVGAQCGRAESCGAFTGDISIKMLQEKGCKAVLCGHSERRHFHGETEKMIFEQVQETLTLGMDAILCIGETKEQKDDGKTEEILRNQLQGISSLDSSYLPHLILAYEPVWAIGTGITPSPEESQKIHAFLRSLLPNPSIKILYGGSLKGSNASQFFSEPDIDGGLIGGAALDCEEFLKIRQQTTDNRQQTTDNRQQKIFVFLA